MPEKARKTKRTKTKPSKKTVSDTLNIEVALVPKGEGLSIYRSPGRPSLDNIERFYADPATASEAAESLQRLGFTVTSVSRLTISVKAPRSLFTKTFRTTLSRFRQPLHLAAGAGHQEFYFPPDGASFKIPKSLSTLVDDAYIQWPHIYFESPLPPRITYHHLRVPGDVSLVLNADRVHREGTTGKGVEVAMVDSGFYAGHPYFTERGYNMSVILAPGASEATKDGNGHGTAECANVFAVAPDVRFIGVKLDNEKDPAMGASLAEGFKTAVEQEPDIITVSLGYDLATQERTHLTTLPNSLKPLEAEVKAAVHSGIVVIFSAGNGHVCFPGMMPEVISVGGTYVDEKMNRQASDYASAFSSSIYPGRHVPDVTGLVGLQETLGAYIMLPVQPKCGIDEGMAEAEGFPDGTEKGDGWTVISGTSAAAPQIAGLCALLKQKNPSLSPAEIKSVLMRTARDVQEGHASPQSNMGEAVKAGPGPDGATGHGLVDAHAAWRQA